MSPAAAQAVGTDGEGVRQPDTFQTIRDNVWPLVTGSGGANCQGGDVCVEKVGDTAEVSWTVQATPLALSSDDSRISNLALISVPRVVENLRLDTVAVPVPDQDPLRDPNTKVYTQPVQEISREVELLSADDVERIEAVESLGISMRDVDEDWDGWKAVHYTRYDSEQGPVGEYGSVDVGADGIASSAEFTHIAVRLADPGVYTFKVSGTVKVQSEDTYLPVRVDIKQEDNLLEVAESLKTDRWARTGAFPDYSLTDPEVNQRVAALQHPNGRLGTQQCSPTSNVGLDRIGIDNAQPPAFGSAGQNYAETFNLILNPAVDYRVAAFDAVEDGCDQADVHITICAPDEGSSTTDSSLSSSSDNSGSALVGSALVGSALVGSSLAGSSDNDGSSNDGSSDKGGSNIDGGDISNGGGGDDSNGTSEGDSKGDTPASEGGDHKQTHNDAPADPQVSGGDGAVSAASQPATRGGMLAQTGVSGVALMTGVGAVLLLAGAGIYLASRRRSQQS